jgi:HSP20 family molecular chaperone IbpA
MAEQTAALTTEKKGSPDKAGEKSLATRDEAFYITPPVDIFENEESLIVVADLPGVDKDGVEIQVDDNLLSIKGKAKYIQTATVLRQEFTLQNYYRQFQLSDKVDQGKIKAESKNGVLTITLPKAEKSKPKQIEVKVS